MKCKGSEHSHTRNTRNSTWNRNRKDTNVCRRSVASRAYMQMQGSRSWWLALGYEKCPNNHAENEIILRHRKKRQGRRRPSQPPLRVCHNLKQRNPSPISTSRLSFLFCCSSRQTRSLPSYTPSLWIHCMGAFPSIFTSKRLSGLRQSRVHLDLCRLYGLRSPSWVA